MVLLAAFRTSENLFLLLFAFLFLFPAATAVWVWLRYPTVTPWCAAVFGNFVVLVAPFLYAWQSFRCFLLLVILLLIMPLALAVRAWYRHPEYSGGVIATLVFVVAVTLWEPWSIFFVYLCLFLIYFGLSITLFVALYQARKHERLAR